MTKDSYASGATLSSGPYPAYAMRASEGSNPVFVNVASTSNLGRTVSMDSSAPSVLGLDTRATSTSLSTTQLNIINKKGAGPLATTSMTSTPPHSAESAGMLARSASRPFGVVCLVLEYCEGGSLLDVQEAGVLLGPCGLVDMNLVWPLLMDVARGMAALHAMGVCHGGEYQGWEGEGAREGLGV